MKKIQITLLVEESKELIAKAILKREDVLNSLNNGKVVLKGGTTVSRISEKLVGVPLKISGRITTRGTVSTLNQGNNPHTLLIEKNKPYNIDNKIEETFSSLKQGDVFIIGANAIDNYNNAAMMAGAPGGGTIGRNLSYLLTGGVKVIIATTFEKLIPGNINELIKKSTRKGVDFSYGMSVGLFPIYGEIFTEIEALKSLANVDSYVIGAGGLGKAKGSITLEVVGSVKDVDYILNIIKDIKSCELFESGENSTFVQCIPICNSCKNHLSCCYKSKEIEEKKRQKLAIITLGQSPRVALTNDLKNILDENIIIQEIGILDNYTYEEASIKFKPSQNENVLVSKMLDGRQIVLSEYKIINEIQKCISEVEKKANMVLLLCTGKFPKFRHNKPLIVPQKIIQSLVASLENSNKIGLIIPEEEQKKQAKIWWSNLNLDLEIEVASPYKDIDTIINVSSKFKNSNIEYIVLDCMGYTNEMKLLVKKYSHKKVILPRTLIARIINETI